MIPQSLLNQYRREVEVASEDARKYIKALTEAYKITYPEANVADIRNSTLEAINDAVYTFGGQSMLVANDFFEEIARNEGVDVEAGLYSTFDEDKAEAKVRYFAKDLINGDIEGFNGKIQDLVSFYVKREAFCNMAKNCDKNGLRYARVPSGRETCAFCFMLASRGFVYWTEQDAGKGHKYHANCDCIIVPGFHSDSGVSEDEQIEGYRPSQLRARYKMCKDTINPDGTWKDVYERWKSSNTEKKWEEFKNDELINEIGRRDTKWLWSGRVPKVDYDPQVDKNKVRAHEKATAELLTKHGFQCIFRKDVLENYNNTGKNIGLADLKNGIELKTLQKQIKESTIDDLIRGTNKKRRLRAVVFDNTAQLLTDEECRKRILESRDCRVPVYLLNGEILVRIK